MTENSVEVAKRVAIAKRNLHEENAASAKEISLEMARQGVTHEEIATKLAVHPSWMIRRLRNQTQITVDDLFEIAELLGVKATQFVER